MSSPEAVYLARIWAAEQTDQEIITLGTVCW
jgi:hypothetical protein